MSFFQKALPFTSDDLTNAAVWAYDKAIGHVPMCGSATELAEDYKKPGVSIHDSVDSLIRWQCSKTSLSGFALGLPGLAAMVATVPADITQSFYVQLRMSAAIAHLYGHNVHSDQMKTMALVCLCGKGATDVLKSIGVEIGKGIAMKAVKSISGASLRAINKAVGVKLFTKFGEKGIVNLGKAVPLLGGIIGGSINGLSTYTIGHTAKNIFAR